MRVDWTSEFRSNAMYRTVPLKRWYVIYPGRTARETTEFVTMIKDAARGMHFEISQPRL